LKEKRLITATQVKSDCNFLFINPTKTYKMGKLNMGILGGFSGTVGTVIGSSNKNGDDIIRAKSKRTRTSNTEAQVNQRTKFALVTQFLQMLNFLLRIGLKSVADFAGISPYNYACSATLKNAVIGTAPDFELNYNMVQISEGNLAQVKSATAVLVGDDVNFQWIDNEKGVREAADKAVLIVYNVANFELSYSIGEVTRGDLSGTLPIPNGEVGDKLLMFLFFQSATNPALVSSNQFLGSVTATV
jgi:hypothetical protein